MPSNFMSSNLRDRRRQEGHQGKNSYFLLETLYHALLISVSIFYTILLSFVFLISYFCRCTRYEVHFTDKEKG